MNIVYWNPILRRLVGVPILIVSLPVFYVWAFLDDRWRGVMELSRYVGPAFTEMWYGPYWSRY